MAKSRGKWLGFSLIIIGTVFLLESTGILEIGDIIGTYWPLLLVLWGLMMLTRPGFRRSRAPAGQASAGIVPGAGISVDCHQGGLADGEHRLTVSGVFGDSRVIVPPGIALDITAHALLGDASVLDQKRGGISASVRYTTPGFDSAPKRLRISVSQVFGDIDVHQ